MKTIKELYGVEVGEKFDLKLPKCEPGTMFHYKDYLVGCYINKFDDELCIYIPGLPGVYELQILNDYLSMGAEIIKKEKHDEKD